jgi:hypothetical protein
MSAKSENPIVKNPRVMIPIIKSEIDRQILEILDFDKEYLR